MQNKIQTAARNDSPSNTIIQNSQISNLTENELANVAYAKAIGDIVAKAQITQGFATFSPGDQDIAVAAWLELFNEYKIPARYINRLYLHAKKRRIELIRETGKFVEFSADFVIAQWKGLSDMIEAEQKSTRLEAKIIYGCRKCFGTNRVHTNWNDPAAPMAIKRITGAVCDHLDENGNAAFSEEN